MSNLLVIIVNWQRPGDTVECIQSLRVAGVAENDILLIDNGSRDSSVDQILSMHSGIQIECLAENLGFAGGYNAGIARGLRSDANHLFLLNNDTTLDPSAIRVLQDSNCDVAIPKILYYDDPQKIWAAGARWRTFPPTVVMNGYKKADGPEYDRPCILEYATGCAIFANRKVFEDLGGFDLDFGNYMEDYDLFFRVRSAGYRVEYVPGARVFHKVSQTLGSQSPERWYYLGRNTVLFYRKDGRFPAWMMWSYLGWYFVRETAKGNATYLPVYWTGVKEGLVWLKKNRGRTKHGAG
jgi:hypothetical protein